MNSKIPIHSSKNSFFRRDTNSRLESSKSRLGERKPLSKIPKPQSSLETPKFQKPKNDIFKLVPTMKNLNDRSLPSDLLGKPKIVGNSTAVEQIFRYIRSIGQNYFVPEFQAVVFPKPLSILHQLTINKSKESKKIPKKRQSIIGGDLSDSESKVKELDLNPVFKQFTTMIKKQKIPLLALTDFIFLYCAYVLVVCEGDTKNLLIPLFFLKQFLQIDVPNRINEAEILVSVLMKQCDADPTVRGHSIQLLAQVIEYNESLFARINAGIGYHNQSVSDFCKEVASFVNRKTGIVQPPPPAPTFTQISQNASEKIVIQMMDSFISNFDNGEVPRDPIQFINNIVQTMQRLNRSPLVLTKGSQCILGSFSLLGDNPPIEIVSEVIELCVSILCGESYLSGNESFEALDGLNTLMNSIFSSVPSDPLLSAIAAIIATTDSESILHLLLKKLAEYCQENSDQVNQRQLNEIESALDAFHPEFTDKPSFLQSNTEEVNRLTSMTESIEKLLNPDSVFQEMERVIALDPEILNDYPLYLRGFLQRAYFLYHNTEPIGMPDDQKEIAVSMVQQYETLQDEDLISGGKYSVENLTAQFTELKKESESTW